MNNNINNEDLKLIIAEINRLSQEKEQIIEEEELKEILRDLNLPLELLDEAKFAIEEQKRIAKKRQKTLLISAILGVFLTGGVTYFALSNQQYQQALSKMNAIDHRITLEEDTKNNLEAVSRQNSPRLHFRVTFENTPVGKPLRLACDWINPQGQIMHENRYQTRTVEKEIWNSRCRYRIGDTSTPGVWQVKMFSGNRLLASQSFEVK